MLNKQIHFNTHMGRMGNQMFQYACAKNLELKHGFSCSMDDLSQLEYFELAKGERWKNRLKTKLFFHLAKRIKGMDVYNLEFEDMLQDYTSWLQSLNKASMVWGFFQSEKYFKESAIEIRHYFKVKKLYQEQFNQFLAKHKLEKGKYNAIHLRRTDYKGFRVKGLSGDDFTLPDAYYEEAIKQLGKELPLLIVSDDPDYCIEKYGALKNVLISKENAITDFQLLSHSAQLAISNSTFAWWAAWLNPHSPSVICPEFFLGFKENKEVPINIYPENWKQRKIEQ